MKYWWDERWRTVKRFMLDDNFMGEVSLTNGEWFARSFLGPVGSSWQDPVPAMQAVAAEVESVGLI